MPREIMGSVQDMLRGEEPFRKAERRFKKGVTAAPEAESARMKMREEELKRLESEPKKVRPSVKISGREETRWREDYKKKEIAWPQRIKAEARYESAGAEVKRESAAETLADEIDAASGKMSQEEWRRVGKMDKDSRALSGPLKKLNEEERKWIQIKKGERPVKKPKYKTEPEKLRPPKQVGQQGEERRESNENEERQAA